MPYGVYDRKSYKPQKDYKNLPFPICKKHTKKMQYQWKTRGIIFDKIGHTFEWWYETYIYAKNCSCCGKKFEICRDKCMEHDHNITDKFNVRGIVCQGCNSRTKDIKMKSNNKCGESNISFDKSRNKWALDIKRNGVKFRKRYETLEEAVLERDKFINANPQMYSIK